MASVVSRTHFDFVGCQETSSSIEELMAEPGFWDDQEKAQATIRRLKPAKSVVDSLVSFESELTEIEELYELAEGDEASIAEIVSMVHALEGVHDALELRTLYSGKHDTCPAIVKIQAGTGGTDASDFAQMLLRLYTRWGEAQGIKPRLDHVDDDDEAGIKSATIVLNCEYAYGQLQAESGVHRLIRISPFNSAGKRQTSFVAVDVLPEIAEADAVEISDKDLRLDFYRAGGAGGQHVNTTDSAVRITHVPTGIVVQCQNERSQHKNKAQAMKMLQARLALQQEMERDAELAKQYGEKGEIAFGSQIRTYTLQPYTLVKDHRTNIENGNVSAVLDGDIARFVDGFLRYKAARKNKN